MLSMEDRPVYRWERRRRLCAKTPLHFQMFDFIDIIFLFVLFFLSLRLFFLFDVVHSPCSEMMGIFMLGVFSRSLVSENYVQAPDGTLNISWRYDNIKQDAGQHIWRGYEEGQWFAESVPACIWLDRNEVVYVYDWRHHEDYSIFDVLGLGKPHIDILMENHLVL